MRTMIGLTLVGLTVALACQSTPAGQAALPKEAACSVKMVAEAHNHRYRTFMACIGTCAARPARVESSTDLLRPGPRPARPPALDAA
jgi:hypothetical protein